MSCMTKIAKRELRIVVPGLSAAAEASTFRGHGTALRSHSHSHPFEGANISKGPLRGQRTLAHCVPPTDCESSKELKKRPASIKELH